MPIRIPQPSMVVASETAYSYKLPTGDYVTVSRRYRMWNTWEGVKRDVPVAHIVDWVAAVADTAPDHYLRVVVLTSHGQGGWLALGHGIKDGLHIADLPLFAKWKNKVANVWIISCNAAYRMPDPKYDGNQFCATLAQVTGAYVVASTDSQYMEIGPVLPWGYVDTWEGLVRRYEPEHGTIDWHYEYRSDPAAVAGFIGPYADTPPIALSPRFRPGGAVGSLPVPRAPSPPQADPPWWVAPSRR
jgi:hypothetical protein